MTDIQDFFTINEQKNVVDTIQKIEEQTSGELKLHLENTCEINVLQRAEEVFLYLNMDDTELSNGVLLYISVQDHQFAVVGDRAINEKVGSDFWCEVVDEIGENFSNEKYFKGAITALNKMGEALIHYFPVLDKNPNELSDEISFG